MSLPKVLFLTLLIAVAGCDDDDDNPVGNPGPDTKAPGIASVQAVDANHIEVKFNEDVAAEGAENLGNYAIYQTATPGGDVVDTLAVNAAVLQSDDRTVTLITSAMNSAPYRVDITGVQDMSGNEIQEAMTRTFTGTDDPDTTPPEILSSDPLNEARDIATDSSVDLVFSEPILTSSLIAGTLWSSEADTVLFSVNTDDSLHVSLVPNEPLAAETRYTMDFDDIQDLSGNAMTSQSLTFTTATQR